MSYTKPNPFRSKELKPIRTHCRSLFALSKPGTPFGDNICQDFVKPFTTRRAFYQKPCEVIKEEESRVDYLMHTIDIGFNEVLDSLPIEFPDYYLLWQHVH